MNLVANHMPPINLIIRLRPGIKVRRGAGVLASITGIKLGTRVQPSKKLYKRQNRWS